MTAATVGPVPRTSPPADALLLDAYAARSCPVKTQNTYDPTVETRPEEPSDALAELFAGGARFEAEVMAAWAERCPGLVDLRGFGGSAADRVQACLTALRGGAPVVLGGWLPPDRAGHRSGRPDALVRGADRPDGRPTYTPVEVKFHKIADRHRPRPDEVAPRVLAYSTLDRPAPEHRRVLPGHGLRFGRREGDFLQLAHYHRMLQAAGLAGPVPLGGLIGTDGLHPEPVVAWADLGQPVVRTFSRTAPEGWQLRSLLERYDHEHGFRVAVATAARAQTGRADRDPPRLVTPIRIRECASCQWWQRCRPQFDPDDVSLRIDVAPLDPREIAALRRRGLGTVRDLAAADLEALLPGYLLEVTHRPGAEGRVRTAARRARLLVAGTSFVRDTEGSIEVPAAEVEVDFDIETAVSGRIYLWGFLVRTPTDPGGSSVQFSRFAELDEDAEAALAEEALGWLRELVEGSRSVAVYHYSGYEVAMLGELARRRPSPTLTWAATYASREFVDLLEIVKRHFFGVAGLGLKRVAREAGFRWRDEDPGGLNSQRWFTEAVHGETVEQRAAAVRRVLEYNEDDVRATREVRAWLRGPSSTPEPAATPGS
ncbi:MAG: TM0106 family RecB-like putative nuclease [Actinomycetes bacterium]